MNYNPSTPVSTRRFPPPSTSPQERRLNRVIVLSFICLNLFLTIHISAITREVEILAPHLTFHQSKETLATIKQIILKREKGAYLRFGDGDLVLAHGQRDLFQAPSATLQNEMREALALNGPTILKTLPLHCKEMGGWEPGMHDNNYHEWPYRYCVHFLMRAQPYWGKEITDVYSMVALCYTAIHQEDTCIDFLNFLKSNKPVVFIGNENVPIALQKKLFGEQCSFIPTPSSNSYQEIDRIEQESRALLNKNSDFKIAIIAMGCSGRILMKRLWQTTDAVFFFDFGSLMDHLCGFKTRQWMDYVSFDRERFLDKITAQ